VAQALTDNPTIEVRIEGHTDSQGSDKFNLKLSNNRAASVRKYLIAAASTARA
jgi:OOP family OmpA-OmpF porin